MKIETTYLSFETIGTQLDENLTPEFSTGTTAGGETFGSVGGNRLQFREGIRVTGTEYKSLMELLNTGEPTYYTPTSETIGLFALYDFPMEVVKTKVDKTGFAGGGDKRYYLEISAESVNYV